MIVCTHLDDAVASLEIDLTDDEVSRLEKPLDLTRSTCSVSRGNIFVSGRANPRINGGFAALKRASVAVSDLAQLPHFAIGV
jgi:hypothetical protein